MTIRRWVAIDTETTGFSRSSRIIELGLAVFEDGELCHVWESLFCPRDVDWYSRPVREALKANGISLKSLNGKPTFEFAQAILSHYLEDAVLVGHNPDFDRRMLDQEFLELGLKTPQPRLVIDTCAFDVYFHPQTKHADLGSVAARWGFRPERAHRALIDAIVTGAIFGEMRLGLPTELAELGKLIPIVDKQWQRRRSGQQLPPRECRQCPHPGVNPLPHLRYHKRRGGRLTTQLERAKQLLKQLQTCQLPGLSELRHVVDAAQNPRPDGFADGTIRVSEWSLLRDVSEAGIKFLRQVSLASHCSQLVEGFREHTYFKCPGGDANCSPRVGECQWCDGGLSLCTVCNGAEASLLNSCPGRALTPAEDALIVSGVITDVSQLQSGLSATDKERARQILNRFGPKLDSELSLSEFESVLDELLAFLDAVRSRQSSASEVTVGTQAHVLGIGPYQEALKGQLQYPDSYYEKVRPGTTILLEIFHAATRDRSVELAEAFDANLYDFATHELDPHRADLERLRELFPLGSDGGKAFIIARSIPGFRFFLQTDM